MRFYQVSALVALVSAVAAIPIQITDPSTRSEMLCENAKAAQTLKGIQTQNNIAGQTCQESACLGDGSLGLCNNGQLVRVACPGGTECQVLPLTNRFGVSITCEAAQDTQLRIQDNMANCSG
ncbi:uncharacterized protein BJ171DRAFT_598670 [Polychytrium aggregatum]|uniref:uncharacterized protein n=1 Tax=Polychytrium aggregatum TaxID=110093 RepID=UPI0022FDC3C0|nr:uncharacterized protein BJ171DRAFT_598670 [Polychytrium aggregatum]KAI9205087.1 hypothetical protein BJ171DRAFT_598670 [Polychytrium aggregatum]